MGSQKNDTVYDEPCTKAIVWHFYGIQDRLEWVSARLIHSVSSVWRWHIIIEEAGDESTHFSRRFLSKLTYIGLSSEELRIRRNLCGLRTTIIGIVRLVAMQSLCQMLFMTSRLDAISRTGYLGVEWGTCEKILWDPEPRGLKVPPLLLIPPCRKDIVVH